MDKENTRAKILLDELKKEDDLRSIIKTPAAHKN
jgi:hypothetical protein